MDSNRCPAHYECAVMRCRNVQGIANPAILSGFSFPRLPTIAGYCVRVRVKLGSRARRLHVAGSFENHVRQALGRPPNRGGEVPAESSISV